LRLTADGQLDGTFGNSGWLTTDFGTSLNPTQDDLQALLLTAGGKIVAAGTSNGDFALARYTLASDDRDGDGVPNTVEDGHPTKVTGTGTGDGNADGAGDADEFWVASLPNAVNGAYVTIQNSRQLRDVQAVAAAPSLSGATRPVGTFTFRVEGVPAGTSLVPFILPAGTPADTIF